MFDAHARRLLDQLPLLPGLDRTACRHALSEAYLYVVRIKLGLVDMNQDADLAAVRPLLRRMADALESAAVFDRLYGVERLAGVEEACAFVAAEALALLAQITPTEIVGDDIINEEDENVGADVIVEEDENAAGDLDVMQDVVTSVSIEAALLYLIGGYDVNAVALVRDMLPVAERAVQTVADARQHNADILRGLLKDFCSGHVQPSSQLQPVPIEGGPSILFQDLVVEVRTWIYQKLSTAVAEFLGWLSGDGVERRENARALVEKVRHATSLNASYPSIEFADMDHLASLLAAAFDRTAERSVAHVLPTPATADGDFLSRFRAYVVRRVVGTNKQGGRPFLWPSAIEFVQQCLPGPSRDAVIAMPTGSGKGFIAELAIANALSSGNVIYLAPTNALVHQIQRDLRDALKPFTNVKIAAFIGSREYTGLSEEGFAAAEGRFVAVMTPEKCALAARLDPGVLATCSLCVFDECHLLNDEHRGITADILLAQLFSLAPGMRFLLMSAMVSNPDQLADWLQKARTQEARPSVTQWRPTRTLRGMLVVDGDRLKAPFATAKKHLEDVRSASKAAKRPRKFDAPLGLIAGLSGPWTLQGGAPDFRFAPLDVAVAAEGSLLPVGIPPTVPSWKNKGMRILAERFARAGIPTIGFVLTSRHHPFSLARAIENELPEHINDVSAMPAVVQSWLAIADSELGVQTELRDFLRRGIATHTSVMLQVEQAAAEWMFQKGYAKLMFATGTLAQGLNLPAVAVVVSGTKMGDPREVDKIPGLGSRGEAAILNAFGRAGRPSFSNQGVAVLVPDKPVLGSTASAVPSAQTLESSKVLAEPDAGIMVGSPVAYFFDRMLADASPLIGATPADLALTAQLAEQPLEGDHAGEVLRRTFGGYLRRDLFTAEASLLVRNRLAEIKEQFLQQPGIPAWMNSAATRAGVDIFRASRLWSALEQHGVVSWEAAPNLSVVEWLALLFGMIRHLPPKYVLEYLADSTQKTPTVMTRLRDAAQPYLGVNEIPWAAPANWPVHWQELHALVSSYMAGSTYAAIATTYYGADKVPIPIPSSRVMSPKPYKNPIPGIFGFIRSIIEPLARDAGCLVALLEQMWKAQGHGEPPEQLQALPLCVRVGCNSLETLAWFRFGFRQRVSAHALATALPIATNLANDAERAAEVRTQRRMWLEGTIIPANSPPILDHISTILRHADN